MSSAMRKLVLTAAPQARSMSAIAIPPRKKVPLLEKVLLGGVLVGSWLFVPAWVTYHIPEYNGTRK